MKAFIRRSWRKFVCSASQMYALICRPLFYFCFAVSLAPGVLLGALLGWKAIFFPAAMPQIIWGLFLPLWFLFSCTLPALCACTTLALPAKYSGRALMRLAPVYTMQLLFAYAWALFLLYRFPLLFCVLSAASAAVSALLCVRYSAVFGIGCGMFMLFSGIWDVFLVFFSAGF